MENETTQNTRKYLRYKPNPEQAAFLECFDPKKEGPFQKDMSALVVSESHSGYAIIVQNAVKLELGIPCRVMQTPGGVRTGKVAWIRELDEDVLKVGIELDS